MKKFRLTLCILTLSLFFSGSVYSQPLPGDYYSGEDFEAGDWSETLSGGAEGKPGNVIAAGADGYYLFEGAVLDTPTELDSPSGVTPYYEYRTVYTGGELRLYNNPLANPLAGWHNPQDEDDEYVINLQETLVITKKYVTGDLAGKMAFELTVTDAKFDKFPGWTASVTANYGPEEPGSLPPPEGTEFLAYGGPLSSAVITIKAPLIGVPVDIKPGSCPNPINVKSKGVLPVAVLGTLDFDVTQINPLSVKLNGIAPLRSSLEDVGTPLVPLVGEEGAEACHELGPDDIMDLSLKFDTQKFVASLDEVNDRETIVVQLTGELQDGTQIQGEDVILILKKGKEKFPPTPED